MESAHKSDLAPFFKDLSQSEKHSEIKPPLHSVFELSAGEKKITNGSGPQVPLFVF